MNAQSKERGTSACSRHFHLVALIILLVPGITTSALAQNYAIDWHVIASGGGVISNSPYTIGGTIGQPNTSHATAGGYTIDSGFWSFTAVVPTCGAPLLTIRLTSSNTVVLSWPSPSAGFVLQSSSSVTTTNWSMMTLVPSDDGNTKTLVVTPSLGCQFFRLSKP